MTKILSVLLAGTITTTAFAQPRLRLSDDSTVVRLAGQSKATSNSFSIIGAGTNGFVLIDRAGESLSLIGLSGLLARPILNSADLGASFQDAVSVLTPNQDEILLSDGVASKIVEFSYSPKSGWKTGSEYKLTNIGISAACTMNSKELFVLSVQSTGAAGGIIHRLRQGTSEKKSFGNAFGQSSGSSDFSYGFGRILCLTSTSRVVVTSRLLPEIRSYAADGSLIWTKILSPFPVVRMEEPRPGLVRYGYSTDSLWAETTGLFALDSLIIVQAQERRGKAGQATRVFTWLLNASTGEIVGTQENVRRIFAVSSGVALVESKSTDRGLQLRRMGVVR